MKHWSKWTEADCKAIYDALHWEPAITPERAKQLNGFGSILPPEELFKIGWLTALSDVRRANQ